MLRGFVIAGLLLNISLVPHASAQSLADESGRQLYMRSFAPVAMAPRAMVTDLLVRNWR
jgi:hypothetical protein